MTERLGLIATASTTFEQLYLIALGHDATRLDPDVPLPEMPRSNESKSSCDRAYTIARRENRTVRQLAQRLGGFGGPSILGTAHTIAEEMQAWLESDACDGFVVMFPYLPAGLDDFVNQVVPELQRRESLRRTCAGTTICENMGHLRPPNQFFG